MRQYNEFITVKEFILDFLKQRGEEGAYVKEMFDSYHGFCSSEGRKGSGYDSFRAELSILRKAQAVENFKNVPNGRTWPRAYYRLGPKAEESYE